MHKAQQNALNFEHSAFYGCLEYTFNILYNSFWNNIKIN